jgi:transketolase
MPEGSTWEAILFAGQHKLDNLIVIVDYNKLQGFGRIDEVMDLEPFANKWKDFGWEVKEVDGHNIEKIHNALRVIPFKKGKPSVLIAHTIKGYGGVQKHIDKVSSQYKPPTEEEYKEAINKLL